MLLVWRIVLAVVIIQVLGIDLIGAFVKFHEVKVRDPLRVGRLFVFNYDLQQLTERMEGSGKAKIIWRHLRDGVDPFSAESLLSTRAKTRLSDLTQNSPLITNQVLHKTIADCGTKKLLIKLEDGLEIETVLIPTKERTTLCVSTQVGCDRGCIFCSTGKMGIIRNLTSSEIIQQVIRGIQVVKRDSMPSLDNIVFMGMGDAGRNIIEVGHAVRCLTDPHRFSMAKSKVTVSTVGPTPEIFREIALLPCFIAWSLHSPNDAIRRKLVPTTKHSTLELRQGLLDAIQLRENMRARTMMVAVTLIDGINDRESDALELVEFIKPMLTVAPKIAINLLPYNDIHTPGLARPSREKVNDFQSVLTSNGLFCSVRVTRGDDEAAACGMLATKSRRKDLLHQI